MWYFYGCTPIFLKAINTYMHTYSSLSLSLSRVSNRQPSHNGLVSGSLGVYMELDEDEDVLDHCAETADQPGHVHDQVVPVQGVEDDAGAVGQVPRQGEDEEQERESCRGC